MDLSFTESELAFRAEVRTFFCTAVPADMREKLLAGEQATKPDVVRWTGFLAEKGWGAPHWPVEYGGTQYGFTEEMSLTPAPAPPFGVNMVAPARCRPGMSVAGGGDMSIFGVVDAAGHAVSCVHRC